MDTIKLKILNPFGDTEHHLSNGDIVHYNINGDMLYYYDDKYKTIETVVYADVGVPYQYKIEIYGNRFVQSFNDAPPFQLDEMFDMLKHKFIRQIYTTGVKYNYSGYAAQTNHIEGYWDVSDIDCYGRPRNNIDISNWDFNNVPTMRELDAGDSCYGALDYGF